jgi:hypothetical protein
MGGVLPMILNLNGDTQPKRLADGEYSMLRTGIADRISGTYLEHSKRGRVFRVTAGAVSMNDYSLTGFPGLSGLYNFPYSGRYASLIRIEMALTNVPTSPVIGAYVCAYVLNLDTGSFVSTARAIGAKQERPDSVCMFAVSQTLTVAPTLYRPLAQAYTGATSAKPPNSPIVLSVDFNGTCLLPPGGFMVVGKLNVDSSPRPQMELVFIWEEINI